MFWICQGKIVVRLPVLFDSFWIEKKKEITQLVNSLLVGYFVHTSARKLAAGKLCFNHYKSVQSSLSWAFWRLDKISLVPIFEHIYWGKKENQEWKFSYTLFITIIVKFTGRHLSLHKSKLHKMHSFIIKDNHFVSILYTKMYSLRKYQLE